MFDSLNCYTAQQKEFVFNALLEYFEVDDIKQLPKIQQKYDDKFSFDSKCEIKEKEEFVSTIGPMQIHHIGCSYYGKKYFTGIYLHIGDQCIGVLFEGKLESKRLQIII